MYLQADQQDLFLYHNTLIKLNKLQAAKYSQKNNQSSMLLHRKNQKRYKNLSKNHRYYRHHILLRAGSASLRYIQLLQEKHLPEFPKEQYHPYIHRLNHKMYFPKSKLYSFFTKLTNKKDLTREFLQLLLISIVNLSLL